jgi:aminocarboxymuconate-semialdehyde decarboxylase
VIDVHAHLVPRLLVEATREASLPNVAVRDHGADQFSFSVAGEATRVLPPRLIDVEQRIEWMDGCGIDVQIVGTWADLFGYALEGEEGVAWARILNQTLAEVVDDIDRLEAFASLPMQAPDAAAQMVGEIAKSGFLGVTFAARVEDMELDHPTLDPVWAALSEHAVPAFIHPGFGAGDPRTSEYGMVNAVGRPVDTTIAAARILGADIPRRFPGVEVILAHGGGALPFILGRLGRNFAINPDVGNPLDGFARMYFDSVVFDPDALCYLVDKASEGSVFMGSDYPFPIGDPSPVDVVEKADCLSESQRRAIAGTSAAELFNLTDTGG